MSMGLHPMVQPFTDPFLTYATSDGRRFGFDPGFAHKPIDQRGTESALAVRIGGLRSHEETRWRVAVGSIWWRNRAAKRRVRKVRMAVKRRRGWR